MAYAGEQLLGEVLGRHCGEPSKAVQDYRLLSAAFSLPDFVHALRPQDFPRSGSYQGRPAILWYWVPEAKFGKKPDLENPLHPNFTQSGVGSGLTHGDPVRLLHALRAVVEFVPEGQRMEVTQGLRNPASHLDAVEELLWLRFWKNLKLAERGFAVTPNGKAFDWILSFTDTGCVYGEVKFIPSSWPMMPDGNAFQLMDGALTGRASKQLPSESAIGELRLVLVTSFGQPSEAFQNYMAAELTAAPNVDAILMWPRIGPIFVMCRNEAIARVLDRRIAKPKWTDFDPSESVIWHRREKMQRDTARAETNQFIPVRAADRVICTQVHPEGRPDPALLVPDKHVYAVDLTYHLATGEPMFKRIPPYL